MLQNIYISDKYCSSELSIHQRNLKITYSAVFNINNKCFFEKIKIFRGNMVSSSKALECDMLVIRTSEIGNRTFV